MTIPISNLNSNSILSHPFQISSSPKLDITSTLNSQSSPSRKLDLTTTSSTLEPISLESNPRLIIQDYPEGGFHAWLTVFGSFSILISSFGFLTSIGTLQAYWEEHQLVHYTSSTVGWISSILVFLSLNLGIQIGPLFDRYGASHILFINSILYILSFFVAAQCTRYWEFVLSIGVLGGISMAGLVTVAVAVPTHWFSKRRGMALGIAMVGSSVGGVSFPFILTRTFEVYGWAWSMRIIGLMVGVLTLVGNLCVRTRLPKGKQSGAISMKCFKNAGFVWATIGIATFEFTLFATLGLLPTYALLLSFPSSTSFALLSILNAFSGLGRFLSSTISDYHGRFNTTIFMVLFTLVVTLSLWFPIGHVGGSTISISHSHRNSTGGGAGDLGSNQGGSNSSGNVALAYVFAAAFGFGSGSVISLAPLCVGSICRTEEFGEWFGTCYFVVSFAELLSIPASAQLLSTSYNSFIALQAVVLFISLISFGLARWVVLRYRWKWGVKI